MTRSFNNYDEVRDYFKNYDLNSWLTNTFELIVKQDGIQKITWSLKESVAEFRVLYDTDWSHPVGTYHLDDYGDLIIVLMQIVSDPAWR